MADRLYYTHFAADPYFNMAFDEWLFSRALSRPGAVYVRLYSWLPGAITFGYNQRRETALDFSRLGDTPVIRRVTGGRAVYHDVSELTYAIALNPHSDELRRLAGSVSATYRYLSGALQAFLGRLDIAAALVSRSSPENGRPDFFHKAPCFASASRYELLTGGRKIVASAQKQSRGVVLQHGSIKISGLAPHPALSATPGEAAGELQPLSEERFERAARLFPEAVGESLGVRFRHVEVSAQEYRGLEIMRQAVMKNWSERRDPVKQTGFPNSL